METAQITAKLCHNVPGVFGGKAILLFDDQGRILPCQVSVELHFAIGEKVTVLAEFTAGGDDFPISDEVVDFAKGGEA